MYMYIYICIYIHDLQIFVTIEYIYAICINVKNKKKVNKVIFFDKNVFNFSETAWLANKSRTYKDH